MPSTLNDIAEEVGVSVMTVSRALANRPGVSSGKRQQIIEVAKRLGYAVNSREKTTTNTIGMLIDHLESDYITEIMYGVHDTLAAASNDLIIYNLSDQYESILDKIQFVCQNPMDGLIIDTSGRSPERSILESMLQRKFPFVLLDQVPNNPLIPAVSVTNYQGAYDATRYLIQLGHRRIGIVKGPIEVMDSHVKYSGFRDALNQSDIPIDESLVINGDYGILGGRQAGQVLLEMSHPPTAVFASNDNMAIGLMETWKAAGKIIPDDLSLIGFDDIRSAASCTPSLTTVKAPLREMGRTAANILLRIIRNTYGVRNVELKTYLVMRHSCAPLKQG